MRRILLELLGRSLLDLCDQWKVRKAQSNCESLGEQQHQFGMTQRWHTGDPLGRWVGRQFLDQLGKRFDEAVIEATVNLLAADQLSPAGVAPHRERAALFNSLVIRDLPSTPDTADIVPYWVYPGPSVIERHVLALPMSREVGQLARLKRSVALYRLVFGQPRQEDLIEYLAGVDDQSILDELRIDLSPQSN